MHLLRLDRSLTSKMELFEGCCSLLLLLLLSLSPQPTYSIIMLYFTYDDNPLLVIHAKNVLEYNIKIGIQKLIQ